MQTSTKHPEQFAALELLRGSLMLYVRVRGELFVVTCDNGPEWQPRNLFRMACVTEDYGFNVSSDPSFATLELAEQHLRERLTQLA